MRDPRGGHRLEPSWGQQEDRRVSVMLWDGGMQQGLLGGKPKVRAGEPGCARGGTATQAAGRKRRCPDSAGTWGDRNLTPVVSVPCSSPDIQGSSIPPPQPPSIRGSTPGASQCWPSEAEAEAARGRQLAVSPSGDGDSGSAGHRGQEGRHRPASEQAALTKHLLPDAPTLVGPWGSLSLATPVAIPPWPQPSPCHQQGPQHPWASPLLPGHFVHPGLEHPWSAEAHQLPPLQPSPLQLVEHPCSSSSPRPPPACLCPSVHPAVLSAPTGWPALTSVSEDGEPQGWHSNPTALGVPWHQSLASAACREGCRGHPCCQSHAACWVLPGCLARAGSIWGSLLRCPGCWHLPHSAPHSWNSPPHPTSWVGEHPALV